MATQLEVERKYEVPLGFTVPDLTGVPGVATVDEPVEHELSAVYYDTPELRLASNRITLRRRTGGDDAGWHIKRPSGGDRTETRLPLRGGLRRTVPRRVRRALGADSGGARLAPVAYIRTRRVERRLRDRDGRVLAVVADDTVSTSVPGDQATILRWREVEVELVDGARPVLDAVAVALRSAGARESRSPSKLARALGDRYPGPPPAPQGEPDARYDDPLHRYLDAQLAAIAANEPGVREGDPDAVHDMRVATRRLRSTFHIFRPLLDRARTEPLRAELKWLADLLGQVRDGDVLAQRLAEAVRAEPAELVIGPVAARINGRLAARTAGARERLVEGLDSDRYGALLDALRRLAADPLPRRPSPKRLRRRARKALVRADRRLDAALAAGTDRDLHLHEARKAYKRGRYAAEVLRPVAGGPAGKLARRLADLQDVLGAHQDAIVAGDVLRDLGLRAYRDGENAFTYGLLHARQRDAGEAVLAKLGRVRRRAARGRVRRWLG